MQVIGFFFVIEMFREALTLFHAWGDEAVRGLLPGNRGV